MNRIHVNWHYDREEDQEVSGQNADGERDFGARIGMVMNPGVVTYPDSWSQIGGRNIGQNEDQRIPLFTRRRIFV